MTERFNAKIMRRFMSADELARFESKYDQARVAHRGVDDRETEVLFDFLTGRLTIKQIQKICHYRTKGGAESFIARGIALLVSEHKIVIERER